MADHHPERTGGVTGKARLIDLALVVALVLLALFMLYGGRWLAGTTIFRGVVQEQYYLIGQYAFDHQIRRDFKAGFFPLWNHLNGLGAPLLGNMLSAALYPGKIINHLFPGDLARDLYILLRLLVAALLAHALARRLGLSRSAALIAALCFSLTGYFKFFVNENYLNADVLLPGVLLFTLRLRERARLLDFFALALLVFFVVNNGHPEAAFFTLLPAAFIVAFAARGPAQAGRGLVVFAAVSCFSLVLSFPMLLPFIELWGRGEHFHAPFTGFFHYPAAQVWALASPWFYGPAPAGAPFLFEFSVAWPEQATGVPGYSETIVPWLCPSLGMTPLLLALIGAGQLRRLSRAEVALLAYSVFFVGVMFGLPLFRWLGLLPIFSFSGNFKHALPMIALSAGLLAGRGLDSAFSGRSSGFRIATLTASLALALLLLGMAPGTQNQPHLNPASGALLLVMTATGMWLAFFVWLRTPQSDKAGAKTTASPLPLMTAIIATASVMFSLVLDGRQQPMRDPGYEARLMDGGAYEWLKRERPTGRVYISQDLAPANMNMVLGLPDLRVMDGVNDRRLVAAINRINDHTRSQGGEYWYRTVGYLQPKPEKLSHPLLRLFNIEFAMTAGPLPYNKDIGAVMEKATMLAPAPGYIGETQLPFNSGQAPGLLAHPPSLITIETEDLPKYGQPDQLPDSLHLRLRPALLPEAVENQQDGAWLIAATASNLVYARHILPRIQPADSELPARDLEYDCFDQAGYWKCYTIKLASLPCQSHEFDQAGWSDLRIGFQKPDHGSWQEMVRGPTWLYHDPEALPRAFFARKARPADEAEALELLASGEVDPRELALVSGVPQLPPEKEPPVRRGPPGLLRAIEIGSQKLRLEVEMLGPGWLVVADLYYPGWRAEVDAEPARIYQTNFLLRGLPLTEGRHIVTMTYQPVPFRIGLWAMIAAITAAAGTIIVKRRRQPLSCLSWKWRSPRSG